MPSTNFLDLAVGRIAAAVGVDPEDLGVDLGQVDALLAAANPHLLLFDDVGHGYNVAEFTPDELTVTMKTVTTITSDQPDEAEAAHRFVVPARQSGTEPPLIIRTA